MFKTSRFGYHKSDSHSLSQQKTMEIALLAKKKEEKNTFFKKSNVQICCPYIYTIWTSPNTNKTLF